MARPVLVSDAKKVIKTHQDLLNSLSNVIKREDKLISSVVLAANSLAEQEVALLLKDISIDELSREKKGLRIKTLKDAGYSTLADINKATPTALSAVNGISEEAAKEIKRISADIAKKSRSEVKIKLNADNRTSYSGALAAAVCAYKADMATFEKCRSIYDVNFDSVNKALADIAPAAGGLKWAFASNSKREAAVNAYLMLDSLLKNGYKTECETAIPKKLKPSFITPEAAWKDFSSDPIIYMTILEKLCPEFCDTDDTLYGLPEDLAAEINEEPLILDGLKCTLRRYQEWGAKYILHQKRVLLGDEMGLGKTVQAIAAMVSLCNSGEMHFMVICPASVLSNWYREIKKHSGLKAVKIHGDGRDGEFADWLKNGGVGVTTFETTGFLNMPEDFNFSMLTVDEAHYIKNPEAKRTQNTKAICAHAARALFMTGTALENNVDEMISLIDILSPSVAGSVKDFAFMSRASQFKEKIAPVYYRRRRDDVLKELPELIENKDWCTLNKNEEKLYEDAILSKKYTDARRVSWNTENLDLSSKAQRLKEIIEDAKEDGRKVIVFSFFLDTIEKITAYFKDICMPPINGSVPPAKRQEIIDAFDKAPSGTVLPAQITSAGTGLNIQTASVVVICEPQFKPSTENQAISRAYRMGQARNVLVHRLLADDTIDEKITDLLEEKQAVFDAFADESVSALESFELDEKTFGNMMSEETERINKKNKSV